MAAKKMRFTENSKDYKAYLDMCSSEAYLHLRQFYGKKTLFDILGVARQENPHSNFLAWLLDPNESHGMNDFAIKRFLETVCFAFMKYGKYYLNNNECNKDYDDIVKQNNADKQKIDEWFLLFEDQNADKRALRKTLMQGNYSISKCDITREKILTNSRRADIFINLTIQYQYKNNTKLERNLLIFIENKIKSAENDEQTTAYMEYLLHKTNKLYILPIYLYTDDNDTMENVADIFSNEMKNVAKKSPARTTSAVPFSSRLFMILNYQYLLDGVFVPCKTAFYGSSVCNVLDDYIVCLGKSINVDTEKNDGDFLVIAVGKEEREWSLKLWKDHKEVLLAAAEEIENLANYSPNAKNNFLIHTSDSFEEQFYRTVLLLVIRYGNLDENDTDDQNLLNKKNVLLTNRKKIYYFKGKDYTSGGRAHNSLGDLAHAIIEQYIEDNKSVDLAYLEKLLRSKWKSLLNRGVIISQTEINDLYKKWLACSQQTSGKNVCKLFYGKEDCEKYQDEFCPLNNMKISDLIAKKKKDIKNGKDRYCLCYYDFLNNFYVGNWGTDVKEPCTDPDWKNKKGISNFPGPIPVQNDSIYVFKYYWHTSDIETLLDLLDMRKYIS